MDLYVYKAELVNVVDGDTFDLHIDVGFYSRYSARFRLYKYDTPELRMGSDFEKEEAQTATRITQLWFDDTGDDLYVRTHKADSFGRWLCTPFNHATGELLHEVLVEAELATEWPTRWRDVYDV